MPEPARQKAAFALAFRSSFARAHGKKKADWKNELEKKGTHIKQTSLDINLHDVAARLAAAAGATVGRRGRLWLSRHRVLRRRSTRSRPGLHRPGRDRRHLKGFFGEDGHCLLVARGGA